MRSALFYAPWQELTHTTTPLGDVTEQETKGGKQIR